MRPHVFCLSVAPSSVGWVLPLPSPYRVLTHHQGCSTYLTYSVEGARAPGPPTWVGIWTKSEEKSRFFLLILPIVSPIPSCATNESRDLNGVTHIRLYIGTVSTSHACCIRYRYLLVCLSVIAQCSSMGVNFMTKGIEFSCRKASWM